ncbi:T9SS type A sorting domain-containing protein [Flavobacterium psychrotrophum]|uniref:T9SS type A sorting domain-containing protein n=1 Tax=Flavobacterium psychrotrophum TaxID=2294119 RepID=UPI000E30DCC2|nr:T9SS type A sorting domain-containing protein [Flavobacterium psychrotrophum]
MKRTLLSGLLLFAAGIANAQLADGSAAPDFTVNDINGVSRSLYADYLNQGKTVIIDISATWCGPCWNYHNSHALEDMYQAYGADGSNEVAILFIEGDRTTSVQSLYGTNAASDTSTTQGNWVANTPYPIIDDGTGAIARAYSVPYFPTVYKICPDGTTKLMNPTGVGAPSAATLKTSINSTCQTLTGLSDYPVVAEANDLRLCEPNGVMKVKIKNYGANRITAATAVIEQNGAVVATKEYTGNLSQFSTSTITFNAADFNPSLPYVAKISNVNTVAPHSVSLAQKEFNVIVGHETGNRIEVRVYTDSYPKEIKWDIKNSANVIVASGGPYLGATGSAAGGADANTIKTSTFEIPEGTIDCYKLTLTDTYGDGWALGSQEFKGIRLYNNGNLIDEFAADHGFASEPINAAFKTNGTLSTVRNEQVKFALYPNPTTGILNISTTENVSISIADITGKTVYSAGNLVNGSSINLSNLQKGIYIAQVKGTATNTTQKIVIE